MGVFTLISHASTRPSTLFALKDSSYCFLSLLGNNGRMMVKDKYPFILIFDSKAFVTLVPIVITVGSGIKRVGQHGTNCDGVPWFASTGTDTFFVKCFGDNGERLNRFIKIVDL